MSIIHYPRAVIAGQMEGPKELGRADTLKARRSLRASGHRLLPDNSSNGLAAYDGLIIRKVHKRFSFVCKLGTWVVSSATSDRYTAHRSFLQLPFVKSRYTFIYFGTLERQEEGRLFQRRFAEGHKGGVALLNQPCLGGCGVLSESSRQYS